MAGYHIRDQRALKISEITKPDRIQAHDRITKRRAEIPIGNFGNNKNPEDNTLPRYNIVRSKNSVEENAARRLNGRLS